MYAEQVRPFPGFLPHGEGGRPNAAMVMRLFYRGAWHVRLVRSTKRVLPAAAAAAATCCCCCCHLLPPAAALSDLRMPALLYLSRTHNIMHRATFPEYIVGNIAYDQAVISIAARQGVHLIEATDTIHAFHQTVRKRRFLRHFILKMIILPRQARDKHREKSKTRVAFA
jgi:hypothetical protein